MNYYTDLTHVWNFAYKMADLINGKHYNNIMVHEFHNPITGEQPYNADTGLEAFQERCDDYYDHHKILFIDEGIVDEYPSQIDLAVRINDEWYITKHGGFNYYLGTGPHGILHLRKACADNHVAIFYHDYEKIEDWLIKKFGKQAKPKEDKPKDLILFDRIVDVLSRLTIEIQNVAELFADLNEENIRDKMLITLNTIFKGTGVREAKNQKGKTDIMIRSKDGKTKYIFELKIWGGIKSLENAIEQLRSYLSWHDKYAGIVILSRNKDFTKILSEVKDYLHEKFTVLIHDPRIPNEFRVNVTDKSDQYKYTQVHITFVNLA
jgi:hypothetical protein